MYLHKNNYWHAQFTQHVNLLKFVQIVHRFIFHLRHRKYFKLSIFVEKRILSAVFFQNQRKYWKFKWLRIEFKIIQTRFTTRGTSSSTFQILIQTLIRREFSSKQRFEFRFHVVLNLLFRFESEFKIQFSVYSVS